MLDGLANRISSAHWMQAATIDRPFVRHPDSKASPAQVWHEKAEKEEPVVSLIIPTSDADRNGYFACLLAQIERQTFRQMELIVVKGDPRQGRAINIGVTLAQGKYLLTLDDDTSLPDPETFGKLVAVMEAHPEIGIAGGNNVIPANASRFVRRVMQEIPRRSWRPVQEITDSDLAEHPCMIMRINEFKALGGENELLPRGLDPYLRQAFRVAGLRVVLVPDVIYHHLPPDNLRQLLRQFFRNGSQAAYVNRHYPQWVIETPSQHGSFTAKRTLPARVFRFPCRLLKALLSLKLIWFSCEISYALGFAFGYFRRG